MVSPLFEPAADCVMYIDPKLTVTTDDIAAPFIKRRPFINDFAADDTYRLIKSCLDTCVFHHPGCKSAVISSLPTRVIDVGLPGARQDPLLFTPPKGFKDSYVAPSYCWGSADSKFVLTKDKALLPKLHFPFSTLPTTLQDAVTITRRLVSDSCGLTLYVSFKKVMGVKTFYERAQPCAMFMGMQL
jgi:hypothetical protein